MTPSQRDLEIAVAKMTVLKFFPAEPIARGMIMDILSHLVGTVEQLDWLVTTVINQVGEWPGPKELRGVFCTRFKPADGIEVSSSVRGFTGADIENQNMIEAPPAQKYLPAPAEEPMSTEERAAIEALAQEIKMRAGPVHGLPRLKPNRTPAWLENLS